MIADLKLYAEKSGLPLLTFLARIEEISALILAIQKAAEGPLDDLLGGRAT